ncbi:MAG: hypothetical protein JO360_10295, partial [Acidobacteria bacterium]|nr:hypothetical protein [Acidobacteriota bacterium]
MTEAHVASVSVEEYKKLFTAELEKERAEEQARLARSVPREALLWMALAPGWTIPLAERCGFPAGRGGVRKVFEQLQHSGLIESTGSSHGGKQKAETAYYYMSNSERDNVLSQYTSSEARFAPLHATLHKIGGRMQPALVKMRDVPAPLRRWALLAANARTTQGMSRVFDKAIEQAFR